MYDVIILGSGIGGLVCASRLARNNKKVLLFEKNYHIGGTSHVFKRNGYLFPMGPLSFSYPELITDLLHKIGIDRKIEFTRNHFQLIAPEIDIIYSLPLNNLKEKLKRIFKEEKKGIDLFINEMEEIITLIKDIHTWHPDYFIGNKKREAINKLNQSKKNIIERIKIFSQSSSKSLIEKYISNEILQNLFGSQGTYKPKMSVKLLANMWYLMSEKGIWFPSCGIHGINQMIYGAILKNKGEVKLSTPVTEILIENNRAIGVKTSKNEVFNSKWIISNIDYKNTFLKLINPKQIPPDFLNNLKNWSITESELCIFLGVKRKNIDLSKIKAQHVFYRKEIKVKAQYDPEDFENEEIEICLWSENFPESAPPDRLTLVLRVNLPFDHISKWWLGEKKRKNGYIEYKKGLANKIIKIVEDILPGLSASIEIMEIATPLTYQDWGNRYHGTFAGWSWNSKDIEKLTEKLLIITPINNLLMVGIYATSELFLGGYPTSIFTANSACDLILEESLNV
ncbi:MAG: phytoene desaturase family protein [Candidatus Hodarchaeota archaeon]